MCDESDFSAFRVQGEEKFCGAVFRRELGWRAPTLHFGKFNLEFSIPNLPSTLCNLDHPYVDRTNFGTVGTVGA
jgi:hypothetical protein